MSSYLIIGVKLHVYTKEEGVELVKAARSSIELFLRSPEFYKGIVISQLTTFKEKHGVFVTLEHYPTKTLRGCIGFPSGIVPVYQGVVDAAIASAFEDPRFVPISHYELNEMLVEVDILSEPKMLGKTMQARKKNLVIGKHGVSVEYGMYRGLLLPNAAEEQNLNVEEFLSSVCERAGLPGSYWMQPNINIMCFEVQAFKEKTPGGDILEVEYVQHKKPKSAATLKNGI